MQLAESTQPKIGAKVLQKNKLNKLIYKIMKKLSNKMECTTTLATVQALIRTKEKIKELIITLIKTQDRYVIYWQIKDEYKLEVYSTIYRKTAYNMFREIFLNDIEQFIKQNELSSLF